MDHTTPARPRRAFTLIEVLIVVVILGILASVVIASYYRSTLDAQQSVAWSEQAKIRRHIEAYRVMKRGQLPAVAEGDGTWGQIVSPEFLTAPPQNTWIGGPNSRRIVFGTTADTAFHYDYGWIYNPSTGEVWAAGFSAAGEPYSKD